MKKQCFKTIIPILLFAAYVVVDYLNVPQLLGVSSNRINMGFFDVFLNSVIVIVLYIITYLFVDRRQIQKDANAKGTADVLLLYTYKECLDNLKIVRNRQWVEKFIIPKVDGNKPANEDKIISNFQRNPFSSKVELLELSKGGYVEKTALATYLHIEKEYKYIISSKIIFYDLVHPETEEQQALFQDITHRNDDLISLLRKEVKRLEETP